LEKQQKEKFEERVRVKEEDERQRYNMDDFFKINDLEKDIRREKY
jgi:hypothetical protein